MHAAIHPLTPGSPAYAIAKIGAVGGLIALRVAMSRRSKRREDPAAEAAPTAEAPARPHPVSQRKANRRRRRP
jgi:hypothetical protein